MIVGDSLRLRTVAYRTEPILLTVAALSLIGLTRTAGRHGNLRVGGFHLANDQRGLAISVEEYHARTVTLDTQLLKALGLERVIAPRD